MQYLLGLLPFLAGVTYASPISKRANGQVIRSVNSSLCISPAVGASGVANGNVGNDVTLVSLPCEEAATWDISRGSGSIILDTTNYAIDAGENPGDTGALKVYQSYPGVAQQTWYFTDDNRIALTGGNQCFTDTPSGPSFSPCETGNNAQEYQVYDKGSNTPSASDSSTPSSTGSAPSSTPTSQPGNILPNVARGKPFPAPGPEAGKRLHPYGREDLCVTVVGGSAYEGAPVEISYCSPPTEEDNIKLQLWDFEEGVRGNVALRANPGLCLDAGNDPANGSTLKLWSCGDGWLQQSWTHSGINLLSLDNNQCLDIRKESTPVKEPYSVAGLQTWECDRDGDRDLYQVFFEDTYSN